MMMSFSKAALETMIVARYMMMREFIEQITAGSPIVGTPIILVQRPISLGLINLIRPN